jgi:hypothetical protein
MAVNSYRRKRHRLVRWFPLRFASLDQLIQILTVKKDPSQGWDPNRLEDASRHETPEALTCQAAVFRRGIETHEPLQYSTLYYHYEPSMT